MLCSSFLHKNCSDKKLGEQGLIIIIAIKIKKIRKGILALVNSVIKILAGDN